MRLAESVRWSYDRVSRIKVPLIQFKPSTLDRIEESTEPQSHPEPTADAGEAATARQMRGLRVFDADVKRFGYTPSCQRCSYLERGNEILARGVRHIQECHERIYEELRRAGSEKIKRADLEDSART